MKFEQDAISSFWTIRDETGTTTHNDGEETVVSDVPSNQQAPEEILVFDETTNDLNPMQNTESNDDKQSEDLTPPVQEKENNDNAVGQKEEAIPPIEDIVL